MDAVFVLRDESGLESSPLYCRFPSKKYSVLFFFYPRWPIRRGNHNTRPPRLVMDGLWIPCSFASQEVRDGVQASAA